MDNCVLAASRLMAKLNLKYTKQYLEDSILSHPDHPSLLSISDTLEKYKIDSLAVKVDAEKLKELPLPCIVQLSDQGGMFHILERYSDQKATYLDGKGKPKTVLAKDFLDRWTGICLLVEVNEASTEPGIEKKLAEKRLISTFKWAIGLLLLVWAINGILNFMQLGTAALPPILGYALVKLVGLVAGTMLLWYEVDKYNPTLQSFCSGGKKVNCDSVLGSKYSKILDGRISLGLLGFSYFFGTFIFLLVNSLSGSSLSPLAYLSFAALPIVIISAYYQGFVIKQWCKFCIVVQTVLLLEVTLAYIGNFYMGVLNFAQIPLLMALLLLPIPIWKWLKPLLEGQKETNLHKRGLKKIKNNPNVLGGLLAKTRKIENSTEGLGISFANEKARYHVVKVCNPYCGPCAKAHPVLEELVEAGKINLQILFTANAEENDIKAKPVRHFLALDEKEDKAFTKKALDDWYLSEKQDYEEFAKAYPMNGELEQQAKKLTAMRTWCDAEKITHTPTIFINGHELPKEYAIEDLLEVLS